MSRLARQCAWGVALTLAVLVLGLVGARSAHVAHTASQLPASTGALVLVGVVGHPVLTATDRAALTAHPGATQLGLVSLPASSRSDCPTSVWASLGAGRSVLPGGECRPAVLDGRVVGWSALERAQSPHGGDAHLGALSSATAGCITAVGPGAAVAAARSDGTVDRVETLSDFEQAGGHTSCPLTIVDAGTDSDPVTRLLAGNPDLTVIVVGLAPAAGSPGSNLQVVYRLGARPSGWLTSRSTRRPGVVTLADLTPTLVDFVADAAAPAPEGLLGETIRVHPAVVASAAAGQAYLDGVLTQPKTMRVGELVAAVVGALAAAAAGLAWARRRRAVLVRATAVLLVLPLAMTLTGLVPWYRAGSPALTLGAVLLLMTGLLAEATFRVARARRVPLAVVAAVATAGALGLDAVSGGLLQEGSLLNPRSLDGGRWYGLGNLTFAVYAGSGLVATGYIVHHLRDTGRRRPAVPAGAAVGAVVLLTDAWPTMGADFGGLLALGPPLLGLLVVLSGRALTWPKIILVSVAGVLVAAVVATLDWSRGPASRTHVGDFVQRLLDGDAEALVMGKAVAAAHTVVTPWGLTALTLGVLAWTLIYARLLRPAPLRFSTIRPVAGAVLGTALLGSVLNDSGLLVWAAMTMTFLLTALSLLLDAELPLRPEPAPEGRAGADSDQEARTVLGRTDTPP